MPALITARESMIFRNKRRVERGLPTEADFLFVVFLARIDLLSEESIQLFCIWNPKIITADTSGMPSARQLLPVKYTISKYYCKYKSFLTKIQHAT